VLDDDEFEREKRRILSGPGGPTARPAT
jgi:hypothetical protein